MPGKLKWGGSLRGEGVAMAWEGAMCHLQKNLHH